MRHMARLIITSIVLLGVMTVGAFAASATSAARPRESDLPAIVTALPMSAPATPTTVTQAPAHPAPPAKPAKSKSSGPASSHRTVARPPAPPVKTPATRSSVPDPKKSVHDEESDHEVAQPGLDERDEPGRTTNHGNRD